jgi:NTE family protein
MGAVIGAPYAAGISGKDIRRHAIKVLLDRGEAWRALMSARAVSLGELFFAGFGNPMLIGAEKLVSAFLPERIPESFEELDTPLRVMTTDYYAREPHVFAAGPLRPALAASMAVPGLVQPVEIEGRVLVDGAVADPLPFGIVRDRADVTLAVDTSVGPTAPRGIPDPWEALFGAIQILGHTIVSERLKAGVSERLKAGAPDLVIRPSVGTFRLLDFFAVSAILRAAEPAKAEVKERLAELIAE